MHDSSVAESDFHAQDQIVFNHILLLWAKKLSSNECIIRKLTSRKNNLHFSLRASLSFVLLLLEKICFD